MRIFQYWNTGSPPDEVAGWIDRFRTLNPDMEHRLYDDDSAAWFIGKQLGPRERRAFETCAAPAMRADYFRLCAILAKGGLYVDADLQCLAPLKSLLRRAPHAMMFMWNGAMTNSFMMFRRPGDPFVAACLKLVTENVEARRFDSPFIATGPAIPNVLRAVLEPGWVAEEQITHAWMRELMGLVRPSLLEPEKVAASIAALTLVHFLAADAWIGTPEAAYKSTGVHWPNWKGPIYRNPDEGPLPKARPSRPAS